jgi:hypothetical protein
MNTQEIPPDWGSRGEPAVVRESLPGQILEPSETDKLKLKVAELENWKRQAVLVEKEWDPQALAKMLGGQLGQSCRKIIQKEVPCLIGRVEDLERERDAAREKIEEMRIAINDAAFNLRLIENDDDAWSASKFDAKEALAKLRPFLTDEPS